MYGQKNYSQELGNGPYSIATAGCFLTAFSNLMVQLNIARIDPPSLNSWFKAHGDYLRDPSDGKFEDLAWNSITNYNPNIQVSATGTGPVPPATPAIVKFYYQSVSQPHLANGEPNMIYHFCLVDHIVNNQVFIVDSWDGLVKGPGQYQSTYHAPIGWATYVDRQPTAPTPVTPPPAPAYTPPAAPLLIPTPEAEYQVIVDIPGYTTATTAGNHNPPGGAVRVKPGTYSVFNTYPNKDYLINVTKVPGKPGAWINTHDNVEPPPAPPVEDIKPTTAPTVTNLAPNINQWQNSYTPAPGVYVAQKSMLVRDLAGLRPDLQLNQGDVANIAGTFKGPDGVTYGRTVTSVANGAWYGLLMSNLTIETGYNPNWDLRGRVAIGNKTFRDNLVLAAAKVAGWLEKLKKK